MIAGCYDLLLTCDGEDCEAGEFGARAVGEWTNELGWKCRSAARRAGWLLFTRKGLCLCPSCVKRGAKVVP